MTAELLECMYKAGRLANGVNMLLLNCYLTPALWTMNTKCPTDVLYALKNVFYYTISPTPLQHELFFRR